MEQYIKKIFIEKSNKTLIQLFRYTFVGGIAFLVDFGLLLFFKEVVGLHYILSASLSFIAGLFVNFIISIYWVFTEFKNISKKLEFLYVAMIGIVGLLLTDLLMWFLTSNLNIYYLVSKIAATIVVFFWNFFARKYLLYRI
jgi:putative flippase GtrA